MKETVKGFKDFSGQDAEKRAEIKKIIVETFEKYGFEPAETPIIEQEKFVKGDNAGDEAVSDVFTLKDKGKRKLALRYEFTFQLKRLAKNKKLPYKRYQIGVVFRDEPVSANRFRQFTQCDVDVVGSRIKDEAEILAMVSEILKKCGIKPKIEINNRKLLNEILDELKIKNKEQAIREIDKFDKLLEKEIRVNLKKIGAEKFFDVVKKPASFFKKYDAYKEIEELKQACKNYGVEVIFSPSLARGLAYYNSTVFEIKSGSKDSIAGGGSYVINNIQATGISFGLERLVDIAKIKTDKEKILVWPNGKDKEAIKIAEKQRKKAICQIIYKNNMNKVFEYANAKGFDKIIFYDKKSGKFKERDLKTGKES